ncbi:Uncharacterised protein [uncultured archaeon]|nr:Uncharacterised protein [uncultured archaeon]
MWIIYPWALYEDMTGFIKKVLVRPMTQEEIKKGLKKDFNITIARKELIEVLKDMNREGTLRRGKEGRKSYWEIKGEG